VGGVDFEFADDDTYQRGVERIKSLRKLDRVNCKAGMFEMHTYHKAKMPPLIQKIAIDVYAVWLAKILRDQGSDGGQVLLLQAMFVLDVAQLGRQFCQTRSFVHLINSCHRKLEMDNGHAGQRDGEQRS
jgi:hypothetical protein